MTCLKKVLLSVALILINPALSFGQATVKANRKSTKEIYHVIMYGQSLMLGTQSVPVISDHQQYNSYMFKGGLRAGYDIDSNFYDALVPLVEKVSISPFSGGKLGETPASGFSEYFLNLIQKENGFTYDSLSHRFKNWNSNLLISIPAQGSTSAKALSDDGEYWQRFKNDIYAGSKLAKAMGYSYIVPFVVWNQGERDIDLKTSPTEYKNTLIYFQSKVDSLVKKVTKQKEPVKLILYQTSSHNARNAKNNPAIANAQYELAKSEPNITMSNATYQLLYVKDNVHFNNIGSKWNGANHAIAAKRILIDHVDWRPIYVKSVTYTNSSLILKFHVPVPPLAFDTVLISNPGNYGFRIFTSNGEELAITSVKILDKTRIKFIINGKLNKGDFIWYGNNGSATGATNGARGNLRDSQGHTLLWHSGNNDIELYNWCPIFKETL